MNDVDVSRQIQQMVRFIRQEAEEKANEISVSAEEEFNIEKLQIVEAEKKKIRQEYERKEKQVDVRKKIINPTIMDSDVKDAQNLNPPITQVATVVGQPVVHPNEWGAHTVMVVGQQAINPNTAVAQGAMVVGQQAVNPNVSCAQRATIVGQQVVNPNVSGAQRATIAGQRVVNLNVLGAQGALRVGKKVVCPNPSGALGATIMDQQAGSPNVSAAQGDTIVGQQTINLGTSGAQGATILGEQAISPNSTRILGMQASHMAHVPQVYSVVPTILVPEKPEKFNGSNFSQWKRKMTFYLTMLNMSRFLEEEGPAVTVESDRQTRLAADTWNNSDYMCRNYVMNCLVDSLYDVYSLKRTTKELWDSLDHKYGTEYGGVKICIVGRFLDYKMVDSETVISQVEELQVIIHEIHAKGMFISESFQVAAIIEKLPSQWKEFKNHLKHKRKEMSMDELILRLRIEEENKRSEKKFKVAVAMDNIVERGQSTKFKRSNTGKDPNNVGKRYKLGPKDRILKTKKFQGKCFNCDKMGHKSLDCRLPKKPRKKKVNVVEEITLDSNPKEWWGHAHSN